MADRGRVGIGKIAGNTVRRHAIASIQSHHRSRLGAIKSRKKGGNERRILKEVKENREGSGIKDTRRRIGD